jgi:hypothetical protein
MLHLLGSTLVRPDRDQLSGAVEVDGTLIDGTEPGLAGRRARTPACRREGNPSDETVRPASA